MTARPPLARIAVGVLALAAAALALGWAGSGPLAAPPLAHPNRWGRWLEGRGPVVAAFSLLRVAAIAVLGYLVVVTLVGAALRMAGAASLVGLADRVTIAPVRRMLAGSLGLGLAAAGILAPAAPRAGVPVAMAQAATPATADTPPSTVTMRQLGPAEPPAPESAPAPVAGPAPEISAPPATWTVEPGECFWSIAERGWPTAGAGLPVTARSSPTGGG